MDATCFCKELNLWSDGRLGPPDTLRPSGARTGGAFFTYIALPDTERDVPIALGGALVARVLAVMLGAVGFVSGAGRRFLVLTLGKFVAVLDGRNGWFNPGRIGLAIAGSFLG